MVIGEKASKRGIVVHHAEKIENGDIVGTRVTEDIFLNLYQKIEKAYGRERIVPTLMLLLAAKEVGVIEGNLLQNVPIEYNGEVALNYKKEIIYRKIKVKDFFSVDVESYALASGNLRLKWKESKKMLAIFANLCIGGGWRVISENGKYRVSYKENEELIFRDIWSETFNIKNGLVNTYNQCIAGELPLQHIERLRWIQDKAETYYNYFRQIEIANKEIIEIQENATKFIQLS